MKRGETYGQQNDCVKILKWVDKRPVLMLTTDPQHTGEVQDTGKKIGKAKLLLNRNVFWTITKPKSIGDWSLCLSEKS
ncbi:hypothetical protein NQ315_011185 [Exocentrus adspersus]|uniref:Uncharacterized protein n=1 Tax=Exocentrus adspersus TaxID=1586481 RepID=A0AAV8V8W6_9CUCU|nr:hypothetical protein NQ315_011185 [Exocentrus adspersus]